MFERCTVRKKTSSMKQKQFEIEMVCHTLGNIVETFELQVFPFTIFHTLRTRLYVLKRWISPIQSYNLEMGLRPSILRFFGRGLDF